MSNNDELFDSVGKIIEMAHDAVAVEELSNSLRNISVVLVAFRSFLVESGGFSEAWAEKACVSLWNGFFPNSPMEAP